MKTNKILTSRATWFTLVAGFLVVAGSLFAVGRVERAISQEGFTGPGGWCADFVAAMTKVRVQRFASELELTDTQKAQIQEIVREHKDELKSDFKAVTDARQALRDTGRNAKQPVTASYFSTQSAALAQAQAEAAADLANLHLEVAALLTAEQKEKLESVHQHIRHRFDSDRIVDALLEAFE